jgi:hypothetical protein
MKVVAKILLTILTIPILLLCILSINIRSQFMSSGFWINTFEHANVYSKISNSIENRLTPRVEAEGGKWSDIGELSNIISAKSIKNIFEDNIRSILSYANGRDKELMLYTPLPIKDNLSQEDLNNLDNYSEKNTVGDFIKEFNITSVNESDFKIISKFGIYSWIFTAVTYVLLLLILISGYLITSYGKHFISLGISLILSGTVIVGGYILGIISADILTSRFTQSTGIGTSLVAIMAPPVIFKITQIWIWFGVSTIIIGVMLLFMKKPVYNGMRKNR